MIQTLGVSNALTQYGAIAFVLARLVYLILYPMGVVGLRTLVWNAGIVSLVAKFVGVIVG